MQFHKKTLSNDLRIVTVPIKDNPTSTVLVLVATGSEYEHKKINGLSHFLEHMCFKGTLKRPTSKIISTELDGMGAIYNAFTGNEFTGYFIKAKANDYKKTLEIVSDIYLNSVIPKEEIEKERGVIKEEISMYNDLPQRKVQEVFAELLYGDTPFGRSIAGPKENIDSLQREDFLSYKDKFYNAKNTVVVISGGIDKEEAEKEAEKLFSKIKVGEKSKKEEMSEDQKIPALKIEDKKTDQTHLVFGFRAFDTYDKRNPIMKALLGVLDGGMSGRLFHKMREELGICYYVTSGIDVFRDHGYFSVSAGVNKNRLLEGVKGIKEEIVRLKNEIISAEELQKAKNHLEGTTFLELEGSDRMAEFFGIQDVMDKNLMKPLELVDEIKKVFPFQIKDLANEIFKSELANIAIIGEVSQKEREEIFETLLSI